ncbi:hypothetical protein MCUN1_002082 [Malassezia cuniculi]|uniref:nitric oxide dioxygenase n=1 Tax=Malassezia cuniculi TaxID=948313 RepID=A0AAF0J672_9BASI|nr:hypothetical protein MCUN1_002082 [Malassezia cuniculi]
MTTPFEKVDRSELSAEHADVIRATLPLVGKNIEEITKLFYKTMFGKHPELLSNKFNRSNQKQGAQQRALASSIATFASMLVDPDSPVPEKFFARIGHKHAALGVTEDEYQIVHDNLFYAIVEVLGADVVTADVAAAWDSVYWIFARTLINFEKKLYAEVGAEPGKVFRTVSVVDRKDVGDVAIFTVEGSDLPRHLPGQYISVGANLPDGARQLRQYSLLDAGNAGGRYVFAVKRVAAHDSAPEGEVSNWIWNNVKSGVEVEISLPFGELVLDVQAESPVVLISAGIGATPMIGMLSSLEAAKSQRTVLYLHAAASQEADTFASQRASLLEGIPNGKSEVWYSHGPGARSGHIDLSQVELPGSAEFYLCGGDAFLKDMRTALDENGIPSSKVHFELFSPNDWLIDY